jgi:hypothetical protein
MKGRVMTTIFNQETGDLQCCPRCGGPINVLKQYVLRGAPATNDAAVTEFVCVTDDCGPGKVIREKVSWLIYWPKKDKPWLIFRPDAKPWGKK